MKVRYVEPDKITHGWCDHCDELAEFRVDNGLANVGAKRLCLAHAEEMQEELSKALFQRRVLSWQANDKEKIPRRSG